MAVIGGGAQATMAVVDEAHIQSVPDSVSWAEAGGFPEAFWTAYDALFLQGNLKMGERVLVTGAAGGVGTAGVQLAHFTGATVVATVPHPARRRRWRLGADHRDRSRRGGWSMVPTTSFLNWSARPAWGRSCPIWPSAPGWWSSASVAAAPTWSSTFSG